MTLSEFMAWLDGFSEAFTDGAPNREQWARIRAKLDSAKPAPWPPEVRLPLVGGHARVFGPCGWSPAADGVLRAQNVETSDPSPADWREKPGSGTLIPPAFQKAMAAAEGLRDLAASEDFATGDPDPRMAREFD